MIIIIKQIVLVAIGGGLGSVCRFLISVILPKFTFPLATFSVNILGCFTIGFLSAYINSHTNLPLPQNMKLLLITGFCGGFTTFSAFAFEEANLLQSGNYGISFAYIFLSVILSISAVFLGILLGK